MSVYQNEFPAPQAGEPQTLTGMYDAAPPTVGRRYRSSWNMPWPGESVFRMIVSAFTEMRATIPPGRIGLV